MAGEIGADISYFQNFNASQYNRPFIFIRASFGTSLKDPKFDNYWAQARAKPVPYRAAYHFLVANVSAQAQFNFFESIVGNLMAGENVMIDDEAYSGTGGLPSRSLVQQFAQLCFNRWGIWPIHYSLASSGRVGSCPQTDASYSATNPGSDLWQYTDGTYNYTGYPSSSPGIGNCDHNVCNGTLANYFLGGAPSPTPTPTPTPTPSSGKSVQGDFMAVNPVTGQMDLCYVGSTKNIYHLFAGGVASDPRQAGQEDLGGLAYGKIGTFLPCSWDPSGRYLIVFVAGTPDASGNSHFFFNRYDSQAAVTTYVVPSAPVVGKVWEATPWLSGPAGAAVAGAGDPAVGTQVGYDYAVKVGNVWYDRIMSGNKSGSWWLNDAAVDTGNNDPSAHGTVVTTSRWTGWTEMPNEWTNTAVFN